MKQPPILGSGGRAQAAAKGSNAGTDPSTNAPDSCLPKEAGVARVPLKSPVASFACLIPTLLEEVARFVHFIPQQS